MYLCVRFNQDCTDALVLADVCDGTIFTTNRIFHVDEDALQIIGYYDEFTIVNPLMSRAKKYKMGIIKINNVILY